MEDAYQISPVDELQNKGHKSKNKSVIPNICRYNEFVLSDRNLIEKSKLTTNDKLEEVNNWENKAKSVKITSALDLYCKTNILDESADFVECESNKFKSKPPKAEVLLCEICKENIIHLDVHNREVHVNNCIDKQIASCSEVKTQTSQNENTFILECPLCFKHFLSPELRSNHVKKCGKAKGLSTQSIIKALELQERHALERISLGLPPKLIKPVKLQKNPVVKRTIVEPKSKAESDIQLAKALSLSLTNSIQKDDAEFSENITTVSLKPPSAHQRPGKKTKKIMSSTPLLVLRTEEDRKKLLLDKVATIVAPVNDFEGNSPVVNEVNISDGKLEDNSHEVPTLWKLSSKASEKHDYYVEYLLDWVKPSDVEMGTKLCHLSQIAGHEIITQLPCNYTFSHPEENDTYVQSTTASQTTGLHASSMIESLCSLVASSWMSDVDIHTSCGNVIPAHKLLLAVRCPPLKKDSDFCSGQDRVVLNWENISFEAALQFLNFVYTGNVNFKQDALYDLSYLANKYEVFDLQTVLHSKDKADFASMKEFTELNNKLLQNIDEPSLKQHSSLHLQTIKEKEITACESQEDTNMDLEIVYNCINSSLKPSQPYDTEFSDLNDTVPFKGTQVAKEDCDLSSKMESRKCELITDYSEKSTASNFLSPEKDDCCPMSPVVFSVNDSDSNASDVSENDDDELPMNCSQKSGSGQSNLNVEQLNLCSSESNSSENSVKFLQSSFTSFDNLHKTLNNVVNSSSSYAVASPFKEFSSSMTRLLQDSPKSDHKLYELTTLPYESNEIVIDDAHSELESPGSSFSKMLHSRFNVKYEDKTKILDTRHGFKDNVGPVLNDLCDDKNVLNNASKIISPIGKESVKIKDRHAFREIYNDRKPDASPKKNSPGDKILTIKSCNSAESISSVKSTASPEVLICDYDSDSKSQRSMICEAPILHKCTMNLSQNGIKFNIPNGSSPEASTSSSCRTPLPLHEPADDLVYDPVDYFDYETSLRNETGIALLQSSKSDVLTDEKQTAEPCDSVFESKVVSSEPLSRILKNAATPSTNTDIINPHYKLSDSPITPLPDYKSMMTPEIRQALRKIGVKALPRKKAVAILSHIYNETHPLINEETDTVMNPQTSPFKISKETKVARSKKRKQINEHAEKPAKKQQKQNHTVETEMAAQDSDDSSSENPEWLGCVPEMTFTQSTDDSPTKPSKDVLESIKQYIQSNEQVYNNILSYKPLNMVEFHQELKDSDIKISIQKLMDFLDEQCITFTCPRKEEYRKKQTARTQRFRKNMIAKLSQQTS